MGGIEVGLLAEEAYFGGRSQKSTVMSWVPLQMGKVYVVGWEFQQVKEAQELVAAGDVGEQEWGMQQVKDQAQARAIE